MQLPTAPHRAREGLILSPLDAEAAPVKIKLCGWGPDHRTPTAAEFGRVAFQEESES